MHVALLVHVQEAQVTRTELEVTQHALERAQAAAAGAEAEVELEREVRRGLQRDGRPGNMKEGADSPWKYAFCTQLVTPEPAQQPFLPPVPAS